VVFLDRAKVIFLGTVAEMEQSPSPIIQQFLELDRLDFRAFIALIGSMP
jgi:ABC-type transporter Mla maintaining outer membrane lipid asymmetry ATPase subunit MlaF